MNGRRALHVFVGLGFLLGSVGAILTPPCHPYSIHLRAVDSAGVDEHLFVNRDAVTPR